MKCLNYLNPSPLKCWMKQDDELKNSPTLTDFVHDVQGKGSMPIMDRDDENIEPELQRCLDGLYVKYVITIYGKLIILNSKSPLIY